MAIAKSAKSAKSLSEMLPIMILGRCINGKTLYERTNGVLRLVDTCLKDTVVNVLFQTLSMNPNLVHTCRPVSIF